MEHAIKTTADLFGKFAIRRLEDTPANEYR